MFCAECLRGAGDGHGRDDAFGIGRRPLQHLHPAHRSAGDAEQPLDAEFVEQHGLRAHHVAHGDQRKRQAIRLPGCGVDLGRPDRAHAAADDVGADDEEAVGVDGLARPHHGFPPAWLAGDGMGAGDELVAGQRMTDQHGIGARFVQLAIGHIGDGPGRERAPAVQRERARRIGRRGLFPHPARVSGRRNFGPIMDLLDRPARPGRRVC